MKVQWARSALDDYRYFESANPRLATRVNRLVEDIKANPFEGIGKPEPLRGALSGWWSRRVSGEHRSVYRVERGVLTIRACRYHYE